MKLLSKTDMIVTEESNLRYKFLINVYKMAEGIILLEIGNIRT